MPSQTYPNAALIRRFAAMLYDFFLIVAIWIATSIPLVPLVADGGPLTGWPYTFFLYFEMFAFYYIFWRIKGQTLGMQVWKIKAVNDKQEIMTTEQCVFRFLAATLSTIALGLGFFWILINRERLAMHDMMTGTRVIYLGDRPYDSEKI